MPCATTARMQFRERYGPWALVAGASEGLGAAFATALAARGLSLVLLARRGDLLASLAAELRAKHGVEVVTEVCDLARPDLSAVFERVTREREIGCAVYNAAYAPIGPLLERTGDELLRMVDVNVRGPLVCARAVAPAMVARGRGGIVLMSSLAGFQGTPRIATYAATKAFTTVLAEGLWSELAPKGVHVVASCAGAIRTPNYTATGARDAPGTLAPDVVAERSLDALGRGPTVIPGATNQLTQFLFGRVLPRRMAIDIMRRATDTLT